MSTQASNTVNRYHASFPTFLSTHLSHTVQPYASLPEEIPSRGYSASMPIFSLPAQAIDKGVNSVGFYAVSTFDLGIRGTPLNIHLREVVLVSNDWE